MSDPATASMIAQFGAAGLVAWMWLCERRAAAVREKQLADAHDRILSQQTTVDVLLRCVDANTRALTSLEAGQGRLLSTLDRLSIPARAAAAAAPTGPPSAGS